MPNSLVIKEYDPQWPILFEQLRVTFAELLGDMVSAIEHVGSTSYGNLKWDLFARFATDRAAYIEGKADFVTQLVQRAIALS